MDKSKTKRTPRSRKPDGMTLEEWQVALRREYGREQNFLFKNVGNEPIFSEFQVTNPQTNRTYRVAIRGRQLGENFCSCLDFAVNALGTCKHIEYTLARLERKRGGKKALLVEFQPEFSEVFLRYGAKRELVFRPGSQCPPLLKELAGRYFNQNGILKEESYAHFDAFLKEASPISQGQGLRCYEDAVSFVAQVRDKANLGQRVDKLLPEGKESAVFKDLLKYSLYPYQREGALFAAKTGRCLIADEMGLGKTVEAIAAIEILSRVAGVEHILIICPTSLKYQWKREIERFTTKRTVEIVEGPRAVRAGQYASETFYKITNYHVIHSDLEMIQNWQPDLVILDEAQRIKNWKTRTAQSVKRLKSDYAIVLTGTPLENRIEEIHSIVEFVDRFHLGPLFRFLAEHQQTDEYGKVIGYRNLTKINETLKPILIRRTKKEVLKELPEKLVKNFFVPMTKEQMKYHEENREIVARLVAKWRRHRFLSEVDQRRLMIALQNMRMVCDSTYLIDQKTDHGAKAHEFISLLSEIFEEPKTKVVVFSQWVRMHKLLVNHLTPRKDFVLFCGEVPSKDRKDLIERFKEDPSCRLFLSTDVGGVGLNLENASVVVNMDQPWNPAVLEQRIGRVHRLGQSQPVRVINFIAQGTIEHGMLDLLSFKQSLFSGVLDGSQDEVFFGGTRLKRFMDTVERAATSIPSPMPQETEPSLDITTGEKTTSLPGEVWTDVISTGLSLLNKISQALITGKTNDGKKEGISLPDKFLIKDEKTGKSCLKLPLPDKDTIQKVINLLNALIP